MAKKHLIYYEVLNYQKKNQVLLKKNFNITALPNPEHDNPEVLNKADVILAPLGYYFGKDKINQSPHLKIIASSTTGTPHIDTVYAEKKNIKVISLKNQTEFLNNITPTAEHTWGLLLSLIRRIPWAFDSVCRGVWNRRLFGGKRMLSTMTIGIVGLGRLGKMVAGYGKSFRMTVKYFDPYVNKSPIHELIKVKTLDELVSTCDIITIHLPLEKETKGLFDGKIFSRFKDGSYLINTSRGEIINSAALLSCLKSGKLSGAALDVIDGEFKKNFINRVKKHPLIQYAQQHDNLIITPHIGGSTIDAWRLTEEYTIQLIISSFSHA